MGLLLTREKGQAILIGEEIEVTVSHFGGVHFTLDIKASERYGGNREWSGRVGDTLTLAGQEISITAADITHGTGQLKLKVDAPKSVKIWRKELRQ